MRLSNLLKEFTQRKPVLEKDMAPSTLSKEVQQIIKSGNTPMIGVEIEVCIPREDHEGYDPEDDPDVPSIDNDTTLDDLKYFFDQNSSDDWMDFSQSYDEWVWEKVSDHHYDNVEKAKDNPELYSGVKQRYMQEEIDAEGFRSLLDQLNMDDDFTNEVVEEIFADAMKARKNIGPASTWAYEDETNMKVNYPGANLYLEIFYEDGDFDHYMYEFLSQQAEEEYWDPYEEFTAGMYIKDYYGGAHGTMYDFFLDNTDWLYWPLGSLGNEGYDMDLAMQIKDAIEGVSEYDVIVSSDYHGGSGRGHKWIIEEDSSIEVDDENDTAYEIVGPAIPYTDIHEIEAVFHLLRTQFNAYTNNSTGLHVNVSIEGVDHKKVDYTKLALLLGDEHILDKFDRLGNGYAAPALDRIARAMNDAANKTNPFTGQPADKYAKFMDSIRSKMNTSVHDLLGELTIDKYTSIGLKNNRIEFRSPGNANYLDDWGKLQQTIDRFVSTYAIAADPEAHKQEYAKKLYRLLQEPKDKAPVYSNEVIKLFSLYSSGKIDKQSLVQGLKGVRGDRNKAKEEKIKAQQKQEYTQAKNDLIEWIKYNSPDQAIHAVDPMLQFALRTERGKLMKQPGAEEKYGDTSNHQFKMDVLAIIKSNLSKNMDYYKELADKENPDGPAEMPSNAPDMSDKFNNAVMLIHQNYRLAGRGNEVTEYDIKPVLFHAIQQEKARGNEDEQALRNAFRRLSADINYYRDTGIVNVEAGFS